MKVHSFVDVITNSSTELFVIDPTLFTVEQVREKLSKMYELLEREGRESIADIRIASEDYEEMYNGYPYEKYSKGDILLSAYDSEFGYEVLEFIEELFGAKRYHLG